MGLFDGMNNPWAPGGISDKKTNREAADSHNPTIEAFCSNIWDLLNDKLNDRSKNPIEDWTGQGSGVDINREDDKWPLARRYYWLQIYEGKQPIKVKLAKRFKDRI